jgi:hypothetical protein
MQQVLSLVKLCNRGIQTEILNAEVSFNMLNSRALPFNIVLYFTL